MENYFNYFTEIEEHFQCRRGGALLLSTLDWALIETWKDAGLPLEAVLRGIDATFDRYDAKPSKSRKINSLAYCSQEVLAAAEDMKEAAVGSARSENPSGFDAATIAAYLMDNATRLEGVKGLGPAAAEAARTLRDLAGGLAASQSSPRLEDLERHLTVMEEKLFAVLLANTPDRELVAVRAEADREIAPYRRNMIAAQLEQLHKQFVHKRLLEKHQAPRLSLFYM
ncbi:MAG TPA: hypothetical protein VMS96_12470 [Terriglobales bacterium]|nr:hypothetical protein [Terriglobales bacterium]